jgi:hypothetical protein
MVKHIAIANRAGVTLSDLDDLLAGKATAKVASRLCLPSADIEDFIRGSATAAMAKCLGFGMLSAAQELATIAGKDGAIGILLGLLIAYD